MDEIRHRAFRHRWSELMWEAIPDGHIFDLCRVPPPLFAYSRVQSHDFRSLLFLVSKNEAHWLPNGSPGDPQIHKKHEIGSSGRGPEKSVELNSKLEALDLRNLCFYTGGVTKIILSTQLQKPHELPPKLS